MKIQPAIFCGGFEGFFQGKPTNQWQWLVGWCSWNMINMGWVHPKNTGGPRAPKWGPIGFWCAKMVGKLYTKLIWKTLMVGFFDPFRPKGLSGAVAVSFREGMGNTLRSFNTFHYIQLHSLVIRNWNISNSEAVFVLTLQQWMYTSNPPSRFTMVTRSRL